MNAKKSVTATLAVASALAACLPVTQAPAAPAQTAQSAMIDFAYNSSAYEIQGAITWSFHKDTAEGYYSAGAGVWNNEPPTCTGSGVNCASSNQPVVPTAPPVPDTGPNSVSFHAQADRCIFFDGGTLQGWSYTQDEPINGLNGKGNWTFTFNYTTTAGTVDAGTAWTSEETGGTVDVGFSGFIASESFQQQSTRNKYSFTLTDDGITRVLGVSAQLQKSDGNGGWTAIDTMDLNNVDTDGDLINDGLAVMVTPADYDYSYSGNAGVFGKPAVYAALHVPGYKNANLVTNILTGASDGTSFVDNFAGNDNDLATGNVQEADFSGTFPGLSEGGDYRTVISGTIKENGGVGTEAFSVTEDNVVIGGCSP